MSGSTVKEKIKKKEKKRSKASKKFIVRDIAGGKNKGTATTSEGTEKKRKNSSNYKEVVRMNLTMEDIFKHPSFDVITKSLIEENVKRTVQAQFAATSTTKQNEEQVQQAINNMCNNIIGLTSKPNNPFSLKLNTSFLTSFQRFLPNRKTANYALHNLVQYITSGDVVTAAGGTETERQIDVLFNYYKQLIEPIMEPFDQLKTSLMEQNDIYPSLNRMAEYMNIFRAKLQKDFNISLMSDHITESLLDQWFKYNEVSRKKKERTLDSILRHDDFEVLHNSLMTTEEFIEFRKDELGAPQIILDEQYEVSDVETLGVLILKEELLNNRQSESSLKTNYHQNGTQEKEIPVANRVCRNPDCEVITIFNGYNSNTATVTARKEMQMPRQRSSKNLKDDTWFESLGIYDHCWVCNFLHSWVHLNVQLILNTSDYVENGLFTVKVGNDMNSFPSELCMSSTEKIFSRVRNFFGFVLAPSTVSRYFSIVRRRQDDRFVLKLFAPGFQFG